MTTSEMIYEDTGIEQTKAGTWRTRLSGLLSVLKGRKAAPVPDENEVDILIEDTIYGVTVRFSGADRT